MEAAWDLIALCALCGRGFAEGAATAAALYETGTADALVNMLCSARVGTSGRLVAMWVETGRTIRTTTSQYMCAGLRVYMMPARAAVRGIPPDVVANPSSRDGVTTAVP